MAWTADWLAHRKRSTHANELTGSAKSQRMGSNAPSESYNELLEVDGVCVGQRLFLTVETETGILIVQFPQQGDLPANPNSKILVPEEVLEEFLEDYAEPYEMAPEVPPEKGSEKYLKINWMSCCLRS